MLQALILCVALAAAADIPEGKGQIAVTASPSVTLDVYTYRPPGYRDGPLIVSFHGVNRNAADYRDAARPLAEALGGIVAAPHFDAKRFPTALYQRGGLVADGKATPPSERTWALAVTVVEDIRRRLNRPDMPCYFIGHSAGGQFLVRMVAFTESIPAVRIIAANPGSQLFPTTDLPYPYGFGELPEELRGEDVLRRYLAAPLTLLVGGDDRERDKNLDVSAAADKQGPDRWTRNHRAFESARDLARSRGWPFNWRLLEAPGVGHSASKMFAHPQALNAITTQP